MELKRFRLIQLLAIIFVMHKPAECFNYSCLLDSNNNYGCYALFDSTNQIDQIFHLNNSFTNDDVTFIEHSSDTFEILPLLNDAFITTFSNLIRMKFTNLQIDKISPTAFGDCKNLEEIYLDRCGLNEIPDLVFENCKNLKILSLVYNSLTEIRGWIFDSLTNLKILKLNRNLLPEVDVKDFENLISLEQLHMSMNKLESFELKDNLPNLQFLDLSANLLESFIISGPSNLISLNLSTNVLLDLPANTFINASNIEVLKLNENYGILSDLSVEIFDSLENLKILELNSCGLSDLRFIIKSSMTNLQELSVQHNFIRQLPDFSLNFSNLQVLKVSSNAITEIRPSTFRNIRYNLKVIDLSHNFIEVIDDYAFADLKLLKTLNLGSNFVKVLKTNMFPYPDGDLLDLDLSYNNIRAIEPDFLERFHDHFIFHLSGNVCIDMTVSSSTALLSDSFMECFMMYEKMNEISTTTTEESYIVTNDNPVFTGRDLAITMVCIVFMSFLIVILIYYINGMLGLRIIKNRNQAVAEKSSNFDQNYQRF